MRNGHLSEDEKISLACDDTVRVLSEDVWDEMDVPHLMKKYGRYWLETAYLKAFSDKKKPLRTAIA